MMQLSMTTLVVTKKLVLTIPILEQAFATKIRRHSLHRLRMQSLLSPNLRRVRYLRQRLNLVRPNATPVANANIYRSGGRSDAYFLKPANNQLLNESMALLVIMNAAACHVGRAHMVDVEVQRLW